MDKFPKLKKTVWVDKPTFQLADPNNPVTYRLKPQDMSKDAKKPSEIMSQTKSNTEDIKQSSLTPLDLLKLTKLNDPDSAVRESEIFPNPEYDQVDDVVAVKGNIHEIIKLDPDDALDELERLGEYDMTDNDRSQVQNSVMEYLKRSGKIE